MPLKFYCTVHIIMYTSYHKANSLPALSAFQQPTRYIKLLLESMTQRLMGTALGRANRTHQQE